MVILIKCVYSSYLLCRCVILGRSTYCILELLLWKFRLSCVKRWSSSNHTVCLHSGWVLGHTHAHFRRYIKHQLSWSGWYDITPQHVLLVIPIISSRGVACLQYKMVSFSNKQLYFVSKEKIDTTSIFSLWTTTSD